MTFEKDSVHVNELATAEPLERIKNVIKDVEDAIDVGTEEEPWWLRHVAFNRERFHGAALCVGGSAAEVVYLLLFVLFVIITSYWFLCVIRYILVSCYFDSLWRPQLDPGLPPGWGNGCECR